MRDRAIILLLLDIGLRPWELCALSLDDVDLKTGQILVRGGPTGGAKGGKSRMVYGGNAVRRSLWRYLVTRYDKDNERAPLFTANPRSLNRDSLRHLVARLGGVAQIRKCHPHRFRHTFAITDLCCGGDVFSLQRLLGHGSQEMVQHYARLAQVDIELAVLATPFIRRQLSRSSPNRTGTSESTSPYPYLGRSPARSGKLLAAGRRVAPLAVAPAPQEPVFLAWRLRSLERWIWVQFGA